MTDGGQGAEPEAVDGDVTPLEALDYAVRLHRSGKPDIAEIVFLRILDVAPDYADALHFYGLLKFSQRKWAESVSLIRRAIELEPDVSGMHSNLGNVFFELERPDLARQAYQMAIVLDAGNGEARNNLGVALRALGRPAEAEEAYREAIAIDPTGRAAWDNLGRLLAATGRIKESISCHTRALELEPANADTRRFLVAAYAANDEGGRALAILRDWLEEEPGNPSVKHLIAAISGENIPERASDDYVEALFDGFASSFDSKLARLDYRAPELVGAAVAAACGAPAGSLNVLDAGCGTGLCAPYLVPYKRRLTGVDLSSNMLAKAAERGLYDELIHAELTSCLNEHRDSYDLIVSADTLCYFGFLEETARAASGALRASGHFVFTVEEQEEGPQPIRLHSHGRFSHTAAHVHHALSSAGFQRIQIERANLRSERGTPVAGLVVTAGRS